MYCFILPTIFQAKISKVHSELEDDECFKPDQGRSLFLYVYCIDSISIYYSSSSTHNKKVAIELLKQVTDQPNNKYPEELVKGLLCSLLVYNECHISAIAAAIKR